MAEPTITCPNCQTEIKLTDTLAAPLVDRLRRQFEEKAQAAQAQLAKERQGIEAERAVLAKTQAEVTNAKAQMAAQIESQVAEQVRAQLSAGERARIEKEADKRARDVTAQDLAKRDRDLADAAERERTMTAKLAEAQKAQADFVRRERELEAQKREMELNIERQVSAKASVIQEQAAKDAADRYTLVLAERDKKEADLIKRLEDVQRKLEQGSQQLQGEVQELALEAALRARFPADTIEEVGKGEHGGDAIHRVMGPGGQPAGIVLWESKRTKSWSDGWLAKLRDDSRRAGADVCVIVSQVLPKGVDAFDFLDGVWVVSPRVAMPLATCLRDGLIHVSLARLAVQGQETKMSLMYDYLTGTRFRQRLGAIVEAYTTMQDDLEKEKKAMLAQWSKRAKQLELALAGAAGMYGDLQGIAGRTLQEIEALELKALGGGAG